MNHWNQTPLFRLLPAFIAGILCAVYGILPFTEALYFFVLLPALVVILQLVRPRKFLSWKRRWIFGASVHVLVFCFAFSLTNRRTEITDLAHFSNQEGVTEYLAFLDNSIQEKKKSFKVIIEVIAVKKSNGWNLAKGKCLLYIAIDSIASSLEYGDLISFKTSPVIVKPPANPEQFNYKQWLAYNQVYQQLYLQKGQWQLKGHQYGNSLVAIAIRMREKLLQ